jgi:hypothetical protein
MRKTTVAVLGAALFLIGFLLGYIPEHQKASAFASQVESARLDSKLREIRELASLSYVEAAKLNYGSAADDSGKMFAICQQLATDTKDDGLRRSLNSVLTFRDTVKGKLSAADASVLEPLQQIVQKTQTELKR